MPPSPKILIVEDEPDFRELIRDSLKSHGYDLREAGNGEEAVAAFLAFAPDLVLLDVMLPDMDGFEVLRRIRSQTQKPKTPVIMCTVNSTVHPISMGLSLGANDYVIKPFNVDDLISRIEAVLASARGG